MEVEKIYSYLLFGLIAFVTSGAGSAVHHEIEGKIVKVVPAEREIYVFTQGEKFEYYFTAKTAVSEHGEPRTYSDLQEGQFVRVTSLRIGKQLEPIAVEIKN